MTVLCVVFQFLFISAYLTLSVYLISHEAVTDRQPAAAKGLIHFLTLSLWTDFLPCDARFWDKHIQHKLAGYSIAHNT